MTIMTRYNIVLVQEMKMHPMHKLTLILIIIFYSFSASGQIDMGKEYNSVELNLMLTKARESKNNQELADIYFLLAQYEENVNNNPVYAFDYYTRALQYYKRNGNLNKEMLINRKIAKRYSESGLLQESIDLYEKTLPYYRELGDNRSLAYINYELSRVYQKRGDPENNLRHLKESIKYNTMLNDTSLLIRYTLDKVTSYINLQELDSALIVSNYAFDVSTSYKSREGVAKSLYYVGMVNKRKGNYARANKYFLNSETIMPIVPYSEDRKMLYKAISSTYAGLNDYNRAYLYANKFNALNDSILNNDRQRMITDLTIQHEIEEKEKNIKFLEIEKESVLQRSTIQKNALYFVAASCFLLLFALYYLIRFYTQKIETEKIITDQRYEINQRKIKDLENTMEINSMQSMIIGQEKERERIAKDLHDSLGGLLSTVKLQFDNVKSKLNGHQSIPQYEKATALLDSAVDEVRTISRNLQPSALSKLGLVPAINDLLNRFKDDQYPEIYFQHYNLEKSIDPIKALAIYRIIQELTTNTIKHANAQEVLIQLNKNEDELILQYEDDGVGIKDIKNQRTGMGLGNLKSRVSFIKGQMAIDSAENDGMSVMIRVPLTTESEKSVADVDA